ncbi:MAG: dienelactone hydrolase family protein [Aureliella sp.]
MKLILALILCLGCVSMAHGEVRTKTVEYRDGDVVLEGFAAWDPAKVSQDAPGVLVVHQWMGLTDYEQSRCRQLAEMGYVAFALDIYGTGTRPENPQEASKLAGVYKADRQLYRKRLNLGLEQLRKLPGVDANKLAAIGYCFGGTGVLELARSGAEVQGVVSFHGGLDSPTPEDGKNIKAKVLVQHGEDDPFVPKADIAAMQQEFNTAGVDWQMIIYSQSVHSFTQPAAGSDNSRGAAYNERSDKRSWLVMQQFFNELFE